MVTPNRRGVVNEIGFSTMTTNSATRIELSYLLKNGYIQKDRIASAQLSWTDDSSIGFESCYTENDSYIRLKYTNTSYHDDEVTKHDYKIQLVTVPSNLGKGEVLYFVCSFSDTRRFDDRIRRAGGVLCWFHRRV